MLEEIKKSLRRTAEEFNTEITDLIEACKMDLELSGIINIDEKDYLIKRAITLYCKGHFGLDNPDSEKYINSYELLKTHMSISEDYIVKKEV